MIYALVAGWVLFVGALVMLVRKTEQCKVLEKAVADQKEFTKTSQDQIEKTFKALASETLQSQSESFLRLAEERLEKKNVQGSAQMQEKLLEISKILAPVKETMSKLELGIDKVEKHRSEQFGRISEQLLLVAQTSERLKHEASSLSKALRRPEVRGSWGEIQLKRVVELAGMSAYCDFEEQVGVRDADKNLQKPDLVVRLPNNRCVIVDSKAVLDAFLDAVETENPEQKQAALQRHAKNLRMRVQDLARKSYWEQFSGSAEFVVLFVPNEALLGAAVGIDKALIEDALQEKVVIATPTTLVALLKAIYYGWQHNQMAENAQSVLQYAKEFYDRLTPWLKHLSRVGGQLEGAVKAYNESLGSLESRVLPSVKRLKEIGLNDREELPELVEPETKVKDDIQLET